jgi:anti-sigma regulatory factor (Ser/Thr protein kinase)
MLPRLEEQTFPGTLDALAPVREYVANAAHAVGLERSATYKLCLAVDEIATNIVLHGYEEAGLKGDLKIGASVEEGKLVIRLEDQGKSYDPNLHVVPREEDLTLPLEAREVGKLGVYLALDGVDDLQYVATDHANIHRFIVLLPPSSGSAP